MFIVLEGIDGCGKTTLANRIVKHLRSNGKFVYHTREPGGSEMAEEIRTTLLKNRDETVSASTEILLFLASRVQSTINVVNVALSKGNIVVCERYMGSTIAYQAAGRDVAPAVIQSIAEQIPEIRIPDVTIYLHIDPTLAQERMRHNGKYDRIEQSGIDFYNKAAKEYRTLSNNPNSISVDASMSADDVFEYVIQRLSDYVRK